MEDIKFVKEIFGKNRFYSDFGNARYYPLANGKRVKVFVEGGGKYREAHGVMAIVIDKKDGEIDRCYFPFENYFKPVQCSPNAPLWTPHIDNGKWYFSHYPHCHPSQNDFNNITKAVFEYMDMFA